MSEHDTLRDSWLACIDASLKLLEQNTGGAPPTRTVKWFERHGKKVELKKVEEPDPSILPQLQPKLAQLPELETLRIQVAGSQYAKSVLGRGDGEPSESVAGQTKRLVERIVIPSLREYFASSGSVAFRADTAEPVYDALISYLKREGRPYSVLAPLGGFAGPEKEVGFPDGTSLRRLKKHELQDLYALAESGGHILRREIGWTTHCVSRVLSLPRSELFPDLVKLASYVENAIAALRLLKPGFVGMQVLVYQPTRPTFGSPGTVTAGGWPCPPGTTYLLRPGETRKLIQIYEAVSKSKRDQRTALALDRFKMAYEKRRPEDRLIDCWVALEALLLPDDPPQELSYRASLRIAYLLGKTADSRERLFRRARQSYRTRSDVVHGRECPDPYKIAVDTEDIVRMTLRLCLNDPKALDVGQLDSRIARGSRG